MKPLPRILLVNWRDIRNPEAGGAEVHLREVARRLVAEGFVCIQYSHCFPGGARQELVDGVEIHRVGGRLLFNYTVWFRVRSWIRKHSIDVVLDDSNKVAFLLPWFSQRPVVAQIHHLFGKVLFKETAWPMALYVLFFEKLMPLAYRDVQVLTGSNSTRKEFLELGFKRVAIAPEGVDSQMYRPTPGVKKRPGLVVYVGRIKKYKRLDTILEAFARVRSKHPQALFRIAGSGDDSKRLRALSESLGVGESVEFLGFVSEEEKVKLYTEASVVVNSSLKEGWGLTSIEANACGTPMVATDVPGLCDSVVDGKTGFLVPFGDVERFAESIDRILSDSSLASQLSIHARQWAAKHNWEGAYLATREAILSHFGPKS